MNDFALWILRNFSEYLFGRAPGSAFFYFFCLKCMLLHCKVSGKLFSIEKPNQNSVYKSTLHIVDTIVFMIGDVLVFFSLTKHCLKICLESLMASFWYFPLTNCNFLPYKNLWIFHYSIMILITFECFDTILIICYCSIINIS